MSFLLRRTNDASGRAIGRLRGVLLGRVLPTVGVAFGLIVLAGGASAWFSAIEAAEDRVTALAGAAHAELDAAELRAFRSLRGWTTRNEAERPAPGQGQGILVRKNGQSDRWVLGTGVDASLQPLLSQAIDATSPGACALHATTPPTMVCRSESGTAPAGEPQSELESELQSDDVASFEVIDRALTLRLAREYGLQVAVAVGTDVVAASWEQAGRTRAEVPIAAEGAVTRARWSGGGGASVEAFEAWTSTPGVGGDVRLGLMLPTEEALGPSRRVIATAVLVAFVVLLLVVVWAARVITRFIDPLTEAVSAVDHVAFALAERNMRLAGGLGLPTRRVEGPRPENKTELDTLQNALQRLQSEVNVTEVIDAEMRAVRASLVDARRAAEAANEAKSRFLANMSHELRTPLTLIIGYAEMALEDLPEDSEVHEDVDEIVKSGRQLLELINQILDLANVGSGVLRLSPERVDIREVAATVARLYEPLIEEGENHFHFECATGIGEMYADPNRLEQVLRNLLSNAGKFTRDGAVDFSVATRIQGGLEQVVFTVRDTGIGMSSEQQATIFEAFTQVDGSTTRNADGSGVGLTTCRHIAEAMGGRVEVQSELGRGSTFQLIVPRTPPHQVSALLIEPDQAARASMASRFRSAGWTLRDVESADEGIATLRDEQMPLPGLILLGLRLGTKVCTDFVDQVQGELDMKMPVIAIRPAGPDVTVDSLRQRLDRVVEQSDIEGDLSPAGLQKLLARLDR